MWWYELARACWEGPHEFNQVAGSRRGNAHESQAERAGQAPRSASFQHKTKQQCVEQLSRLLSRETLECNSYNLSLHSEINSIRRQVDVFDRYQDYLPEDGTILDWGCKHAPDSCLIRYALGDGPRLLGYDFGPPDAYQPLHDYAGLEYTAAEHPYQLPYDDESIDAVISGGVLEHVAITTESLKELYRVTKVGGILAITFLPNRLSYTECFHRSIGSNSYHRRLYTPRLIRELLLHHGFDPQLSGYHQFIPGQRGGMVFSKLWFFNGFLERCWPFRSFCANLFVVAIKRRVI